MKKRVIIVGAGAGGLEVAKRLSRADLEVILIDKNNHHLFQPLLFHVAAAVLSPGDIAAPVRSILSKHKNIRVVMGEVVRFDAPGKQVKLSDGSSYAYDYLVIATGIKTCYYGNDCWEEYAPGLKTLPDALLIREKILVSMEKAEIAADKKHAEDLMTFVVVGGGPTGVETAGALAELVRSSISRDFRRLDTSKIRIILIEALERILGGFDPGLSTKATRQLEKLGVEVMLGAKITRIDENGIWLGERFIGTSNVIWAAGTMAPAELATLDAGAHVSGRVYVKHDCSIENYPEVFVIGDAGIYIQDGQPLPQLAPVAVQQAEYVSRVIRREIEPARRPEFKYKDKGNVAVVGRGRAVMQIGRFKITGFPAWLAWVVVHVIVMVGFRNKLKVMGEWIWHFLGNRHGVRLIIGYFNKGKKPDSDPC